MIKLLATYLDINQIENAEKYLVVGELMIKNPSAQMIFLNQKKYILSGFQDLLNGKSTPEIFFQLGDIDSPYFIDHSNHGIGQVSFLFHQISSGVIQSDSLVVIDEIVQSYITSHAKSSPELHSLLSKISLQIV
ncbi:MAG TPA: hypothetical protein PKD96_03260 [Candidatus Absconditabacterales bacterium]|nr:hypothetical protein [Candidatus Absconditabacterales bacterium]HMT27297.1 hypothetical protein [Candidatus Absconditabacterales bacterium]